LWRGNRLRERIGLWLGNRLRRDRWSRLRWLRGLRLGFRLAANVSDRIDRVDHGATLPLLVCSLRSRSVWLGFLWLIACGVASPTTVEESLELRLRHPGATVDPAILRFFVQLPVGPSTRAGVGTQPPAPTRGQVVHRRATRRPSFARSRAFLVDGPRGELLRRVLRPASLLQPFLDVFVLTLALLAPRLLRHVVLPLVRPYLDRTRPVWDPHVSEMRLAVMVLGYLARQNDDTR